MTENEFIELSNKHDLPLLSLNDLQEELDEKFYFFQDDNGSDIGIDFIIYSNNPDAFFNEFKNLFLPFSSNYPLIEIKVVIDDITGEDNTTVKEYINKNGSLEENKVFSKNFIIGKRGRRDKDVEIIEEKRVVVIKNFGELQKNIQLDLVDKSYQNGMGHSRKFDELGFVRTEKDILFMVEPMLDPSETPKVSVRDRCSQCTMYSKDK